MRTIVRIWRVWAFVVAGIAIVGAAGGTLGHASAMFCCGGGGGGGGGGGPITSGTLSAPYSSSYTYLGHNAEACAQYNNDVGPTATTSNGYVEIEVGAIAAGCGGASILSQGGFYTDSFTPGESGNYYLQVIWGGSFEAELATALGVFGTSHAGGYAIFYFNVIDQSTGYYVFGSYQQSTLYNPGMIDDGLDWADNSPDLWVDYGATGYLYSGTPYEFVSYIGVYCEAIAVGLVDASCVGNFGSDLNSAILVGADWSLS
jgi:hypothetical protein